MLIPGGYTLLTLSSTQGYRHDNGRQLEPGTVILDIGKGSRYSASLQRPGRNRTGI